MATTSNPVTYKDKVYTYLRKNRKYIPGSEINQIGGKDGLRRLRELRAEGVPIVSRQNPKTGVWEYRIK
jgi:hypothetical protein